VKRDTEAYCSAKVKMEHIYIIKQMRQNFDHVHIKHFSHFLLLLAFVRNVSSLQHTSVTASQGQNSVHGIDVLDRTAISRCFAWLLTLTRAFNEFGPFYFI